MQTKTCSLFQSPCLCRGSTRSARQLSRRSNAPRPYCYKGTPESAHTQDQPQDSAEASSSQDGTPEVMRSADRAAVWPRDHILSRAETELSDYCNALEGEVSERCWDGYQYYENRKAEAEAGCSVEEGGGRKSGPTCDQLDRFESFVWELVGAGNVVKLAQTLATLASAERRRQEREQAALAAAAGGAQAERAAPSAQELRRAYLTKVFYDADRNSDGHMDASEFREAMRQLGDPLSAHTVNTIFEALDIHGFITLDQFFDICEAEEVRAHSQLSKALRTIVRNKSSWWSSLPDSVSELL